MRVAVLVPRRRDHGIRDTTWEWVLNRWGREHPAFDVYEGHHDDGLFNRSAAINRACDQAGDAWDVAVIADADTFVATEALKNAVHIAAQGSFTLAYDRFCYLSKLGTRQIMGGFVGMWEPFVEWTMAGTCSSMVVVNRELWDAVGGFDEGFVGWGMEDVAFSLACQGICGGLQRVAGPAWHLWHPPSGENAHTEAFQANVDRLEGYRVASAGDTDTMRGFLAGRMATR